jgi:hypothetical protein
MIDGLLATDQIIEVASAFKFRVARYSPGTVQGGATIREEGSF